MTHVKFSRKPFDASIDSLVNDLFNDFPVLFKNGKSQNDWKGFAPVNIRETKTSYILDVIAPGFEKSDFKVNIDQDILTISAEKKAEVNNESADKQNEKNILREYSYRSFKRSFTLDEKIDGVGIDAKYVNGVLTLNLPKKEEVKSASKDISVQ